MVVEPESRTSLSADRDQIFDVLLIVQIQSKNTISCWNEDCRSLCLVTLSVPGWIPLVISAALFACLGLAYTVTTRTVRLPPRTCHNKLTGWLKHHICVFEIAVLYLLYVYRQIQLFGVENVAHYRRFCTYIIRSDET